MNYKGIVQEVLDEMDLGIKVEDEGLNSKDMNKIKQAASLGEGALVQSIQEHDARYHKKGYKEGAPCTFRDAANKVAEMSGINTDKIKELAGYNASSTNLSLGKDLPSKIAMESAKKKLEASESIKDTLPEEYEEYKKQYDHTVMNFIKETLGGKEAVAIERLEYKLAHADENKQREVLSKLRQKVQNEAQEKGIEYIESHLGIINRDQGINNIGDFKTGEDKNGTEYGDKKNKEISEKENKYNAELSEEAKFDVDDTLKKMVESGVLSPEYVDETKNKAISKIGGRDNGEHHEIVEHAVMEAAEEVQRLHGEDIRKKEEAEAKQRERDEIQRQLDEDNSPENRKEDALNARNEEIKRINADNSMDDSQKRMFRQKANKKYERECLKIDMETDKTNIESKNISKNKDGSLVYEIDGKRFLDVTGLNAADRINAIMNNSEEGIEVLNDYAKQIGRWDEVTNSIPMYKEQMAALSGAATMIGNTKIFDYLASGTDDALVIGKINNLKERMINATKESERASIMKQLNSIAGEHNLDNSNASRKARANAHKAEVQVESAENKNRRDLINQAIKVGDDTVLGMSEQEKERARQTKEKLLSQNQKLAIQNGDVTASCLQGHPDMIEHAKAYADKIKSDAQGKKNRLVYDAIKLGKTNFVDENGKQWNLVGESLEIAKRNAAKILYQNQKLAIQNGDVDAECLHGHQNLIDQAKSNSEKIKSEAEGKASRLKYDAMKAGSTSYKDGEGNIVNLRGEDLEIAQANAATQKAKAKSAESQAEINAEKAKKIAESEEEKLKQLKHKGQDELANEYGKLNPGVIKEYEELASHMAEGVAKTEVEGLIASLKVERSDSKVLSKMHSITNVVNKANAQAERFGGKASKWNPLPDYANASQEDKAVLDALEMATGGTPFDKMDDNVAQLDENTKMFLSEMSDLNDEYAKVDENGKLKMTPRQREDKENMLRNKYNKPKPSSQKYMENQRNEMEFWSKNNANIFPVNTQSVAQKTRRDFREGEQRKTIHDILTARFSNDVDIPATYSSSNDFSQPSGHNKFTIKLRNGRLGTDLELAKDDIAQKLGIKPSDIEVKPFTGKNECQIWIKEPKNDKEIFTADEIFNSKISTPSERQSVGWKPTAMDRIADCRVAHVFGKRGDGTIRTEDPTRNGNPHTLVIGATNSGKTEMIKSSAIANTMKGRKHVRTLVLDGKAGAPLANELGKVDGITTFGPSQIKTALKGLVQHGRDTMKFLSDRGYSNINDYNNDHPDDPLPYYDTYFDEAKVAFDDDKEIQPVLSTILHELRSAGIYMTVMTQEATAKDFDQSTRNGFGTKAIMKCDKMSAQINGASGMENSDGLGDMTLVQDGKAERLQAPLMGKTGLNNFATVYNGRYANSPKVRRKFHLGGDSNRENISATMTARTENPQGAVNSQNMSRR